MTGEAASSPAGHLPRKRGRPDYPPSSSRAPPLAGELSAQPTEGAAPLNLDWITPTLAVAGEVPSTAWPALAAEGVRAVVDLRAEACDDADALRAAGIAFRHLPTLDHAAVSRADIDRGVSFVRTAPGRVVVHCQEGVGRSALLALCVLVDAGAKPLAALMLAKDRRWQVSPSPAQYQAWAAWLNGRGVTPPGFEAFAAVAYRHLAT